MKSGLVSLQEDQSKPMQTNFSFQYNSSYRLPKIDRSPKSDHLCSPIWFNDRARKVLGCMGPNTCMHMIRDLMDVPYHSGRVLVYSIHVW
jgi:hypothetical protein